MAIEFECPACSTTIRVPDAFSGKRGKCPGCSQALQIPSIPIPGDAPAGTPEVSGAGDVAPETAIGTAAQPTMPQAMAPPAAPAVSPIPATASFRKTRRRSRRPSRALVIGMPVAGFLILLAILGYSLTDSLSGLQGEISGNLLAGKNLPDSLIPWSDTGLTLADQDVLRQALADRPEILSSETMACRLVGSDQGIMVRLTAAAGYQWCLVNAVQGGGNALGLWLKQNRKALTSLRRKEFTDALQDYCRDKVSQINGDGVSIDATRVRDQVAVNFGVNVLGYAVHGVMGTQIRRPVKEDAQGRLYFVVPQGTQKMTIIGRSANSGLLFGGQYDVAVAPASPQTEVSAETPSAGSESTSSDSEFSEDMNAEEEMSGGMSPSNSQMQ